MSPGSVSLKNKIPQRILPVIVFSQFAGTSLWFAGNAILPDLPSLEHQSLGTITSAVQLGFITGTFCSAFFVISDKYSPRVIFLFCSLAAALANLLILTNQEYSVILVSRFLTGFFLAGIYPIGMKIAAGWYQKRLGKAIGFLVGALVLGKSFPYYLKSVGGDLNWMTVIIAVSIVAIFGGLSMFLMVPDGPFISKGARFNLHALPQVFKSKDFRAAAFGYFGHMWELYAFWAFIPFILTIYNKTNGLDHPVNFWAFIIIAVGSIGCVLGGLLSEKIGSSKVAFAQLSLSGLCCIISPFIFLSPPIVFYSFMAFWGVMVVGDSPQFSAITASTAPKELVGTGITIVTSVGFAITIISLQLVDQAIGWMAPEYVFLLLAFGPAVGLLALLPLIKKRPPL